MGKKPDLRSVLKETNGAPESITGTVRRRPSGSSDARSHRAGKYFFGGHVDGRVRKLIHQVKAQCDELPSNEELLGEALELLFMKYKVVGAR